MGCFAVAAKPGAGGLPEQTLNSCATPIGLVWVWMGSCGVQGNQGVTSESRPHRRRGQLRRLIGRRTGNSKRSTGPGSATLRSVDRTQSVEPPLELPELFPVSAQHQPPTGGISSVFGQGRLGALKASLCDGAGACASVHPAPPIFHRWTAARLTRSTRVRTAPRRGIGVPWRIAVLEPTASRRMGSILHSSFSPSRSGATPSQPDRPPGLAHRLRPRRTARGPAAGHQF